MMEPTQSLPDPRQERAMVRQRRRAAKACDGCRRQKEKCEGGAPCRRCARLRRVCEFSGRVPGEGPGHDPSAPGPSSAPALGSVHRSPSASADQDAADPADRMSYLERIVRKYAGNINLDTETLRHLAENADRQKPPRPPPSAPPAAVSPDSAGSVDFGEGSFCIKPLENNMTHYSGEFSHWNFSMRIKQWIDQTVPNDAHNQPPNSNKVTEYYRAEELQPPSSIAVCAAALPPRFVATFLVQSFFTHGQANYWYVERGWLEQKLDTVYDDVGSLTHRDVGTVCMIFMILAIGTQYAYLDTYGGQAGDSVNAETPEQADAGLFSEDTIGVMFYQQACRLLPDVIVISSLESVQACLLIGIYTLPIDTSGLSYVYLNLAVKLAIQNGMHRRYLGQELDPFVRETRNRVWWTAYTIERRVGIFHGRPISISDKDVDADFPVDAPGLLASTAPDHTAHFLATLRLNQILSKMSHEISMLRTYTRQEISNSMGTLLELRRELVSWWESLPHDLSCKDSSPKSSLSRLGLHLKLEYCLVRIFVGRAFIFPNEKLPSPSDKTESSVPPRSSSAASPAKSSPRSILVADCIDASLAVMDTCRLLRDTIGLARASYTEFSACRAALLVITTQCLQKRTDRFFRTLRDGLSMFKEMSAGGESARSEISLIEAFERAIAKLDAGVATAEKKSADSQYTRFKRWEQLWKSDQSMDLDGSQGNPLPMAPLPAVTWEAAQGQQQRQGTMPMPSQTPFFGMDGNFASFPQTLDEFSMCFGYNLGPSPDSAHTVGNEGGWMGDMP